MLDLLTATYKTPEASAVLDFPDLAIHRGNLARAPGLLLPRKAGRGGAGGDYRYSHLLEMLLSIRIGHVHTREIAKEVTWQVFKLLRDRPDVKKKANAIQAEALAAYENDELGLAAMVTNPEIFLGEENISRDPGNPTFVVFNPAQVTRYSDVVLTTGSGALLDLHRQILDQELAGVAGSPSVAVERSQILSFVNLTGLLNIMDARCLSVLEART